MRHGVAPPPLAAWYPGHPHFDDRTEIHPVPPGRSMPPRNDLEWAVEDAVRSIDGDVYARVEAGARSLNLSAWGIQNREYQLGLDAALDATQWLRSYAEIFREPWGWADTRHAAAFYNAAVVFWHGDGQTYEINEMLSQADAWLARVQDEGLSTPSYLNVVSAVRQLRDLL